MNDPRVPAVHRAATVLLALYLVVLAAAVFLPAPFAQVPRGSGPRWNLQLSPPDLLGGWETQRNVLMTIPFGVLLPLVVRWRYEVLVLACVALTLTIETVQLLVSAAVGWAWRAFDVSDLVLNTLGGVIGLAVTGVALLVARRTTVPPARHLVPGAGATALVVWAVVSTVAARDEAPVVHACDGPPVGAVTTLPGGASAYAGAEGSVCLRAGGSESSLPRDVGTGFALAYDHDGGTWEIGTASSDDEVPAGDDAVEVHTLDGSPVLLWTVRH